MSNRSKVKENGNVVGRNIIVRESVSGFHGSLGYSIVEDVTDELDAVLTDLENDEVEEARERVEAVLELCEVMDD